jgi:hypothetical protein
MKMLMRAAYLGGGYQLEPDSTRHDDMRTDSVFNMRDNQSGLNLDFMSYASYVDTGKKPYALLDLDLLLQESQKIFSIFFQHYVDNNVSQEDGGWAYQPIGADLTVNPPMKGTRTQLLPNGKFAPRFEDIHSRNTSRTVTATLTARVEVLRMNLVAFAISTSILAWLAITTIVFMAMQRRYLGSMQRNVECIADVLVMIAGSERFLAVVREEGIDTIIKEDMILTRLGWFRDSNGVMRWRIELVENK